MKKFFLPIIWLSVALAFIACDPKEDPTDPTDPDDTTKTEEVFVSKTAQNRNVLLEEYTGINCGYCPDGHKIADSLHAIYGDKFIQINIHAGSFAPAYKTPEGTALNTAFNINSYPAGVVSRELVNTGSAYKFGISRSSWNGVASQIMAKPAYANVAAKTTINQSTRKLTCKVQVYFTDSSAVDAGLNYINIALVQNNILGSQSGAIKLYPEMYDSETGKYKHNHMLRALINGVDGESIPNNTKKTLYSKTFTYDIPETISNVDVVLEDVDVIVFVTQNTPNTIPTNFTDVNKEMPRVINVCKSALTLE